MVNINAGVCVGRRRVALVGGGRHCERQKRRAWRPEAIKIVFWRQPHVCRLYFPFLWPNAALSGQLHLHCDAHGVPVSQLSHVFSLLLSLSLSLSLCLSVAAPSLLLARLPFSFVVLFISTSASSFPCHVPGRAATLRCIVFSENRLAFSFNSKKHYVSVTLSLREVSKDTTASFPNCSEKYADTGLSIIYDIGRFFRQTSSIRSVGINERAMPYTRGPSENWLEHYQRANNNYRFLVTICDRKYTQVDNESKIGNSLRNKVLYKINYGGKLTAQKPQTSFPKLGLEFVIVYIASELLSFESFSFFRIEPNQRG